MKNNIYDYYFEQFKNEKATFHKLGYGEIKDFCTYVCKDIYKFENGEEILLSAFVLYLWKYRPDSEQTFESVMKLLRAFDFGSERFNKSFYKTPIDRIFDEVAKRDNGSLSLKSYYNFRALSFRRQEEIISNLICAFNFADKESAHVDFEEKSKKLKSLIEILNSENEELDKKVKERRKMLFKENDDNKNEKYVKERNKSFKELYKKRFEAETGISEDKKEIPVKKELDLNWLWNGSEENSKDDNLLDEFKLEEIKEDKKTSNNFTPVKDDIEEFKPEIKEENEKIITDLEPINFEFPDLNAEFDKKDN